MGDGNILRELFPQRTYTRLRGYDYSQPGFYFVTICTRDKECLFGVVEQESMNLNAFGEIVRECWKGIPQHCAGIENEVFVVMPNHVHGIIVITERTLTADRNGRSGSKPDPTRHSLSEIVRGFKTYSARAINERRRSQGIPVWQRGFYEHVIRDDREYRRIGEYITHNAAKWEMDVMNPRQQTSLWGRVCDAARAALHE